MAKKRQRKRRLPAKILDTDSLRKVVEPLENWNARSPAEKRSRLARCRLCDALVRTRRRSGETFRCPACNDSYPFSDDQLEAAASDDQAEALLARCLVCEAFVKLPAPMAAGATFHCPACKEEYAFQERQLLITPISPDSGPNSQLTAVDLDVRHPHADDWPVADDSVPPDDDLPEELRQQLDGAGPGVDPDAERIGRYTILDELGRGGMGIVYHAHDPALDRDVAIKVIKEKASCDSSLLKRFKREVRAAAKLNDPRIVFAFEVGEHDGMPFMVMDYIEGESFEDVLRDDPEPEEVVDVVQEVALALEQVHLAGLVHRDVKPQNIVLDGEGNPHLTDFGLVKDLTQSDGLSWTGEALGTPVYMSPEQASGSRKRIDRRTDIYSLGAVLYRGLTGRPPFKAKSVLTLLKRVMVDSPRPVRELNPDIDPELEAIVMRCLEKKRRRRYQTAAELAEALEPFC